MALWRYIAVEIRSGHGINDAVPGTALRRTASGNWHKQQRKGEMSGSSSAEVRSALRHRGLQVISLNEVRSRAPSTSNPFSSLWCRAIRNRRRLLRADFFDGAASMLRAGVPLLETLETVVASSRARHAAFREMVAQLADGVRSGSPLAVEVRKHPTWFDPVEVAMIEAGEHAGTLDGILERLAHRLAQADEFNSKLIGALVYPIIVAVVALGVAAFLSTRTLPPLAQLLVDANVEVPRLTRVIMALGDIFTRLWITIPILVSIAALSLMFARRYADTAIRTGVRWIQHRLPAFMRRKFIANLSSELAHLLRAGVPLREALLVSAPMNPGSLRDTLDQAVCNIEDGQTLSSTLAEDVWFGPEFARLLQIAETTGHLPEMLERIGERYRRQSTRFMERFVAFLEPATILLLALVVGTIAMAALLPILRLKEAIS